MCLRCGEWLEYLHAKLDAWSSQIPKDDWNFLETGKGCPRNGWIQGLNDQVYPSDIVPPDALPVVDQVLARFNAEKYSQILHPARRGLFAVSEYGLIWLGSIDYVQCAHCDRLDQELYGLDDDVTMPDYGGMPYEWGFTDYGTCYGDMDEGEGYFPSDMFNTRSDHLIEDRNADDEPFYSRLKAMPSQVCFRFKSCCYICGYKVAPSTTRHCLACYYSIDVLNELIGSLTRRDCGCLENKWNRCKQWPFENVTTHCIDWLADKDAVLKAIAEEREFDYQDSLAEAKASWIQHQK